MANATAPYVVTGPARTPALYGLFSVLDFRETLDRRWENGGVTWHSVNGGNDLGVIGPVQESFDDTIGIPKTFFTDAPIDGAGVFTIYGQQKITPISWSQEAARDYAKALLAALGERTVESVLSGETPGLEPSFVDASPIGASIDVAAAVALAETWLGNNYGSRGVLHMGRAEAIEGLAAYVLEVRGNGLYTRLGTKVVAGSGYPAGSVFATSALIGYRSEVFEDTRVPYDLLDKDNNDLYAIAEQTYCIGFEFAALGLVTIGESGA